MQLSGKRALALVAALSLATAGSAFAQDTTEAGGARFDTTEAGAGAIDTATADTSAVTDTSATDTSAVGDTTDTSGVQNPPGYRGMERDTTIFPPQDDSAAAAGRVEDKATGTYDDSAWQDTSATEQQNPPGYRGMERPVGGDSAAGHDTSAVRDTTDTSGVQNPPGYRGMERDTTIFPPQDDTAPSAGRVEDKATGTYDDSAWQDTSGAVQNPPGYRGMERPVGEDSAAGHDTTHQSGEGIGDTTAQTPDSAQ